MDRPSSVERASSAEKTLPLTVMVMRLGFFGAQKTDGGMACGDSVRPVSRTSQTLVQHRALRQYVDAPSSAGTLHESQLEGMEKVRLVNRLGELMAEQELGIQKLCRIAEVSPNTVIKMRRNAARYLDVETTARICRALGVTPGELLEIQEEGS